MNRAGLLKRREWCVREHAGLIVNKHIRHRKVRLAIMVSKIKQIDKMLEEVMV